MKEDFATKISQNTGYGERVLSQIEFVGEDGQGDELVYPASA